MDFFGLLSTAKSGSEFLSRAETLLRNSDTGFTYAEFARKSGFAARSYVREVFQGKKTMTAKALPQFIQGFGLRREEGEILRSLFNVEIAGFDPLVPSKIAARKLQAQRRALLRRNSRKMLGDTLRPLEESMTSPSLESWPRIYAALGGKETDFSTLVAKSKLSALVVERALRAMLEAGMILKSGELYRPVNRHVVLDPTIHSEMIRKHFISVTEAAISNVNTHFNDPERLYFVSSFGIRKGRIPELKRKLIETLLRFVDDSEDGDQEEVVSIATTLL